MKAVVYEGPRQVSVEDVPDARIRVASVRFAGKIGNEAPSAVLRARP